MVVKVECEVYLRLFNVDTIFALTFIVLQGNLSSVLK